MCESSQAARPCGLCTVLRRTAVTQGGKLRPGTGQGLRIALVDGDREVRLTCQEMVRGQRGDWELRIYDPCCPGHRVAVESARSPKGAEAPDHVPKAPPDIVLIPLAEKEDSRLTCLRRLKALVPELPVLVIGKGQDCAFIAHYCMAGANGCLMKPLGSQDLACAVRSASQGHAVLCPRGTMALFDFLREAGKCESFRDLPQQQQEILVCLGANLTNKDIGERLGMSHHTVHVQVARLLRKARVHTRSQLVRKLLRLGKGAE